MNTENKLPEDFKQRWVAALRSGEYPQGKGTLHNNGNYCCIAVAARVKEVPIEEIDGRGILNKELARTYDIPAMLSGAAFENTVVAHLTGMNDSHGCSFSEIADWIEQNL